jgi:hypothetical protein
LNWSTLKYVFGQLSLSPTLGQAGWEIPASSAARLVGVAGPRMQLARRFAAEGAIPLVYAIEQFEKNAAELLQRVRVAIYLSSPTAAPLSPDWR